MIMQNYINRAVQKECMKKYILFILYFLFIGSSVTAVNPYDVIGNYEADWEQYGWDALSGSWGAVCGGVQSPTYTVGQNVTFNITLDSGISLINYTYYSNYYSGYSYFNIYLDGGFVSDTCSHTSTGCKTCSIDLGISDTNQHELTFTAVGHALNDVGFNKLYYDGLEITNPNHFSVNYDFDISGYSSLAFLDVAIADLDADGDGDLIANNGCFGDAQQNIGNLSEPLWFANSDWDITITGGCTSGSVGDLADIDGDSDFDYCVAYGLNVGAVKCFENNGTIYEPSWNYRADWGISSIAGSFHVIALADVNGDNLIDMFVNTRAQFAEYFYQNTGNSTYPIWTLNNSINPPSTSKTSVFVDLDYDGDYDFYAGSNYYENIGDSVNPIWSANTTYNLPRALITEGSQLGSFDIGEVYRDTPYGEIDPDFMMSTRDGYIIPLISNLEFYPEAPCISDITCTAWSSCYISFGDRIKQRLCVDNNDCSSPIIETTDCGVSSNITGEGFYSSTAPEDFILIPAIIVPSTDNNEPNINSQTITGFGCFTNWYGFGDITLDRMEYTVNNITSVVYPNESIEPCGKGLDCPKPYGYIQSWDYMDNYFTQYDDYDTEIILKCYGADLSSENLTIDLNPKEEDYCYISDESITKECFSYSDELNNHIYSATDINLKPTFAFDLDRIQNKENIPDWQMYRVTTDIVNYFSDEIHINDAKDIYNKIAQKEGYQIVELFTTPKDKAQVYIDFYTSDMYPKYFSLTDSDGQIQILIMFYNNVVYYFDGYSFKSMGDYSLDTPYTLTIDFDVDNQRFKLGLNTWYMYLDDTYNIYSWKKIGAWQYDAKIGTFVSRFDDAKDIKYFAMTLMSELCNTDSDCSSIVGSQNNYGGSTSTTPAFSNYWGFKQIKEHLHTTDGSYLRYFDDEQSSNIGISTINSWDDLTNGIYNNDSIISIVWKAESEGLFCFGEINKTINISTREGMASWSYQDTLIVTSESTAQSYSTTSNISFDQVKLDFEITGGICFGSSRGSIDVDSIRATNITNSSGGECRDIDWFAETFTNTSGNLEWAFNKSMNNSLFMLEWSDEIYDNLKLDETIWSGGYCYSDMVVDNIETFTTKSTFHSSDEDSQKKIYTYAWLEKLGWNLNGNQGEISGETGAYVSDYYNWDVCTDEGREYNVGTWCILNVHGQVLWDIVISSIYGDFLTFIMFIFLLMALSTFLIMVK